MTFTDERARQRYLPQPKHEGLKKIFRPVLKDLIVFKLFIHNGIMCLCEPDKSPAYPVGGGLVSCRGNSDLSFCLDII